MRRCGSIEGEVAHWKIRWLSRKQGGSVEREVEYEKRWHGKRGGSV
jgi:hypothetical protein